jgi:mycothiol synthase
VSVELRPPRKEDAPAIADALNEFSRLVDFDLESPDEIVAWFSMPSFDFQNDARVALVEGAIVGYADATSRDQKTAWLDVRADPAYPEAPPVLLDFVEERGKKLAPGGLLKAWTPEKSPASRELLESRGYAFHHYSLRMLIDLAEEPPEPEWPDGITVRTFRPGEEQAVYEAHQETFSDQRDFSRERYEDWSHWWLGEGFDPELWFLAVAGDEIRGISLCRAEWGGDEDLGWVSILGVRRPWRQRGVGLALLVHSFRELRARGKKRAGLGVDAENPTGAVQLYERAGMTVNRRHIWYDKPAKAAS